MKKFLIAMFCMLCVNAAAQVPYSFGSIIHKDQVNDSVLFFKYDVRRPGKTQYVAFDLVTRNHWKNNPTSHFAVVLQGAFLDPMPGIRGVGLAFGSFGSTCQGAVVEQFNNPVSFLMPETCRSIPLQDDKWYRVTVYASETQVDFYVLFEGRYYWARAPVNVATFGMQRSIAGGVVFNPSPSTIEVHNLIWGWF